LFSAASDNAALRASVLLNDATKDSHMAICFAWPSLGNIVNYIDGGLIVAVVINYFTWDCGG